MSEEALEDATRRLLERLDSMDIEGMAAIITDDAQGVDELTRGWRRGREALEAYFAELEGSVTDLRSSFSDLQAIAWGDVGLVTFVLEQTYKLNGEEQNLSAPTSMVFRRDGPEWKMAMVHSVPLPES